MIVRLCVDIKKRRLCASFVERVLVSVKKGLFLLGNDCVLNFHIGDSGVQCPKNPSNKSKSSFSVPTVTKLKSWKYTFLRYLN